MTDKLRPLFDRVLIELEKAPDKIGSIHIPGTDEGRRIEPGVKRGDRVIVGEYSGTEIEVDGVKQVVVREDDILGVVE